MKRDAELLHMLACGSRRSLRRYRTAKSQEERVKWARIHRWITGKPPSN